MSDLCTRPAAAASSGEVVHHVLGEVDLAVAADLQQSISEAMAATRGPFVLDCGHLTFIDACGLRVLVWFSAEARRQGRQGHLRNPTPMLERMLRLTGLEDLWEETSAAPA